MKIKNRKKIINKLIIKTKIKGSMLLEALIGMLIFSFGIMGLALFQGVTMVNNAENTYRAEASMYVNEVIGQMWAKAGDLESFEAEDELIPRTEIRLLDARKTIEVDGNKAFIKLTWKRPNDNTRGSISVSTIITPNG